MTIRLAQETDIEKIGDLLSQVDLVHHNGRPDIFKIGKKYNDEQIREMLKDKDKPILVCTDSEDKVLGYCFCVYKQVLKDNVLTDIKTLYVDDLCVDQKERGKHVGKTLLTAAEQLAKETGCYNLTLNVWTCNSTALKFYEACGYIPQKIVMEKIL